MASYATVQDILGCFLLFILCIFFLTVTTILIVCTDYTSASVDLDVIKTRLTVYKAQLQEMDVESSRVKAKVDVMLRSWKEDIAKQTRTRSQHASVRVGEREATRLRTAVESSCVRIERVMDEFGWLLGDEGKGVGSNGRKS